MDLFTQYDSINILLKRNDAVYQEEGRFQDLEESRVIDKELKDMLSNNSIDYKEYIVNDDTVDDIFNYINTI